MKRFVDLRTSAKILLFFLAMVCVVVATAGAGLAALRSTKANQDATFELDFKGALEVRQMLSLRLRMAHLVREAIIQVKPETIADNTRQMDQTAAELHAMLTSTHPTFQDAQSPAERTELDQQLAEILRLDHVAIDASPTVNNAGDPAKLFASLDQVNVIGRAMQTTLDAMSARAVDRAMRRAKDSQLTYDANVRLLVGLVVGMLVLGSLGTRMTSRAIAGPLEETADLLGKVAAGDLTVRLGFDRQDEIGKVAQALDATLEWIRSTLAGVASVSSDVSSASSELASNAEQIASGAQEQAASLEETAASLEEISSTVKQNTDNAEEASRLANGARGAAERGGQVVGAAVSAMTEITKSSKKIADIITMIDEIAFQTKLLALNAAVEAARAGEQGRGFGVVAGEVRALAQRTGAAAKEIRALIADSAAKVETGTQQVNESGRTLDEIVRAVTRMTDMATEIAVASREQSSGLDQVNGAVTQVDQVTQGNASRTEELSATATALSDKSTHLQELVAAFQLGERHALVQTTTAAGMRGSPVADSPPSAATRGRSAVVVPISRRSDRPHASKKAANGGVEEF